MATLRVNNPLLPPLFCICIKDIVSCCIYYLCYNVFKLMVREIIMKRIALVIMSALALVGCANHGAYSSDVYGSADAKRGLNVSYATIVSVRQVTIQGGDRSPNLLGTIGGGVIGGLLGNQIGGGDGKKIATAAGALVGAVGGNKVENRMNQVRAVELELQNDNGERSIVVQKFDKNWLPGQKVRVISNGNKLTVAPLI